MTSARVEVGRHSTIADGPRESYRSTFATRALCRRVAGVLVLGALAACGSDDAPDTSDTTDAADTGAPDSGELDAVEVDASGDTALPDVVPDIVPDIVEDTPGDTGADADQDTGGDTLIVGDTTGGDAAGASCEVDFDCEPGEACVLERCGPALAECDVEDDCDDVTTCVEGRCLEDGVSADFGRAIVNEVLADGSAAADANGDGTIDEVEDELVEIVNVSNETLDLSGWTLVENDFDTALPRHTFPAGTTLAPAGAVVVFGGGDAPASTSTVAFVVANAADPGVPFGLDLDDAGDTMRLLDAAGDVVALVAWGPNTGVAAVSDESLTRVPDLTGPFAPHASAAGAEGAPLSPGTRVDGTAF